MKNISIKDTTEFNKPEQYTLSILICKDGFCYTLFNKIEKKFEALVSENIEISEKLKDCFYDFVKRNKLDSFNDVKIVIAEKKSTIVPEAFFEVDAVENIYNLNFFYEIDTKILYSKLEKSGNYIIFSVDQQLLQIINSLFAKYKIYSQSHSFIENHFVANKLSENPKSSKIYVQVFGDFFDVLVLDNLNIKFYNTYSYKTNNDFFYYLMNIFEQLKISVENSVLVFSGYIETDNITVLNLRKFVAQVCFESQNLDYKYYYRFQEIAPHYYFNFLNIVSCV